MDSNYYMKTKKRWLGMIDKQMKAARGDITERYGPETGTEMLEQIRATFEMLLPEIPRLDPETSNLWTRQLVLTAIFLSVYKVMTGIYQKDPDEAWEVCMVMFGAFLKRMPRFVKKMALKSSFSKRTKRRYQRDEIQLDKRLQPEGDILHYVDGKGKDFDYCMIFTECAKVKYLKKNGAEEFAPYVCLVDRLIAEAYGVGLVRRKTIADGYEECDFTLTNNGVIRIESPVWKDEWEEYL